MPLKHVLIPGRDVFLGVVAHDLPEVDGIPFTLEYGQLVRLSGASGRSFVVVLVGDKWCSKKSRHALLVEVPSDMLLMTASECGALQTEDTLPAYKAAVCTLNFVLAPLGLIRYDTRVYANPAALLFVYQALTLVRADVSCTVA